MNEFDPTLVEQVAGLLYQRIPNEPMWSCVVLAKQVLTAVAPALMAQGAAKNALDRQLLASRLADRTDEVVRQRVEIATAYQRGKVEGARQVRAAVEAATARRNALGWANDAAREAVARIEGGHICGDHPAPCNHDPARIEGGA